MNQNKSIQEQKETQGQTKFSYNDQEQNQSRRLVGGEIHRLNNKRGCPPNKQILAKNVSIEPKKPLQKILHFKAHFTGASDQSPAIPTNKNASKANNANQCDLYHQVSQSQRAKFVRAHHLDRQTELGRPKANSGHQNAGLRKFEGKGSNARSHEASPINNKLNKGTMNCEQNNQETNFN